MSESDRPRIVCLCGSGRFADTYRPMDYFHRAAIAETLAGRIVIGPNFGSRSLDRSKVDELHLRRIDLADEILVLNVGGYIGESTRSEIQYAVARGKAVRYLEDST